MKIFKSFAFYLTQLIVCAVFFEIFSHLYLVYTSNPLYRARRILQYDSQTGWMQKSNMGAMFEKKQVFTDEAGFRTNENSSTEEVFKFITLGPSSAFGWGVDLDETYSSLVAAHYKVNVLNASVIGHSVIQGNLVWQKKLVGKNLALTHAFIAYGINDLDKFRFFDSTPQDDKTFFASEPLALKMDKRRLPTDSMVVLSLIERQILYKKSCEDLIHTKQRVSWIDYEKTLDSMVADMRTRKITPIIINTPFYLKHKNPAYSKDLIESTYQEISKLAQIGKCDKARELMVQARFYEPDNILEQVNLFNEHLKGYAVKNKLQFIDAYQILAEGDMAANFIDPVHPSRAGHQKIAGQIIATMLY